MSPFVPVHAVRTQQGRVPGHWRAPIVNHDDHLIRGERVQQTDHITNQVQLGIALDHSGRPVWTYLR